MNSANKGVAIVTGAGSGIGRHCAIALLQNGFHVVLAGRTAEKLDQSIAEAGDAGSNALAVQSDVTAPESVRDLFAAAKSHFGRLDLLFNNAGTNIPRTNIEDISIEQWQSVVNTNLTGVFLCTQEAIRLMKSQHPMGGRIINNGSISAHVPRPGSIAYTATKPAVTGLTKSTGLDCRQYNIACGQIDIGNADTTMASRAKVGTPQADGSTAIEPMIDPDEVARAILYMANLPLEANVPFMTVMATKMPYIGRG
jgi:NAD(P)-dependent dehydrogenase (short-subunit alcohol dehydrogenase family)